MNDLFEKRFREELKRGAPLADKMRPDDFTDFYGQDELVGEGSPLRQAIQSDNLRSLIFWGPPGSGKTTLARIIAQKTEASFIKFSAVDAGVKEIRGAVEEARNTRKFRGEKTILFIDEIHRFNKAQQDRLLPHVEKGIVTLIGATTENPSFEIIPPLLSRSAVYILKSLSEEAMERILIRALKNSGQGLGDRGLKITKKALKRIVAFADGDARAGLNALEAVADFATQSKKNVLREKLVQEVLKKHALRYDRAGEEHYNVISAFIKSMRDSETDAALYWLARMVESGEDPRFVARRMVIFASEDIGNADPHALEIAVGCARAVEFVGMPEAQINLAHGVTYLSNAPKSRASYDALMGAKEDAEKGSFGVPLHLRNAITNLMKKVGYGRPKQKGESHFPKEIGPQKYYFEKDEHGERGKEN